MIAALREDPYFQMAENHHGLALYELYQYRVDAYQRYMIPKLDLKKWDRNLDGSCVAYSQQ